MTGNLPLVSICIPCYNAAPYIRQTLDCLLAQSYNSIEIIVVDDGSTDESLNIIKSYSSRGVIVASQSNAGQCAAANHAYRLASGTLIKFMDADDLLSSDYIERQVDTIGSRSDAVASAGWGRFYDDDLNTFKLNPEAVWRSLPSIEWLITAWLQAQPMMQCALWLIPRSVLEKSGLWDESLNLINDFEFFSRVLSSVDEVLFTPHATLYYRSGISGSLSSRKSRPAAESAYHSIVNGTYHLLQRCNDSRSRLACANMMQSFIYTFYPDYPDLRSAMCRHILLLGGSKLSPPGTPWFHRARRLIGWRAARHLQRLMGRT